MVFAGRSGLAGVLVAKGVDDTHDLYLRPWASVWIAGSRERPTELLGSRDGPNKECNILCARV